ncbi:MAG: hypothetical protein WED33_13525 [Bacteroidia bacterium]
MSLSTEQKRQLDQLNKIFKPFSHLEAVSDEQGELAVHEQMVEQFQIGDIDRSKMNELSERRKAILEKQGAKLHEYSEKK